MRLEYNKKEKQLRIIASNSKEQDELAALAEIMRHGDLCNFSWVKVLSPTTEVYIGGAVEIRFGKRLECEIVDNDSKFAMYRYIFTSNDILKRLIFLWVEEKPKDGWNVLVFSSY